MAPAHLLRFTAMSTEYPHYLLFSQSSATPEPGHWRFELRALNGSRRLVAEDTEPDVRGERLELLTVVRGLEALEQPSRVTVMTPSTYIREGIRHGILQWRESGWLWEFFGQMVPVKNGDLWQRMDRALRFHRLDCRSRPHDWASRQPVTAGQAGNQRKDEKDRRIGICIARLCGLRYLIMLVRGCRRQCR